MVFFAAIILMGLPLHVSWYIFSCGFQYLPEAILSSLSSFLRGVCIEWNISMSGNWYTTSYQALILFTLPISHHKTQEEQGWFLRRDSVCPDRANFAHSPQFIPVLDTETSKGLDSKIAGHSQSSSLPSLSLATKWTSVRGASPPVAPGNQLLLQEVSA